ncbi:hypothetical protein LINGRAHAP2_LOCUS16408, partial [Linum grandiflorum]
QTKYGESYDCVDFYQQPAFDHPLLKDHKYEYKVAVLRTTEQKKYHGGAMVHSIYRPTVQGRQYSSSRLVVRNGVDSIAAGWTVNPSLYPDNEPHFFIYTNTKDSHCYNTYCPGFIITSSKYPLDLLLKPYSTFVSDIYTSDFYVGQKDAKTGDWFLWWRNDGIIMGYWPRKIFTNLADSADYIEWGGEVYSPPGIIPPPMGSGVLYNPPKALYNCFAEQIGLINENYELDLDPQTCILYHTSERYSVIDVGYLTPPEKRVIFYGGPNITNL